MLDKPNRGGARPGAGPKFLPEGEKKKVRQLYISDQDWIAVKRAAMAYPNVAAWVVAIALKPEPREPGVTRPKPKGQQPPHPEPLPSLGP